MDVHKDKDINTNSHKLLYLKLTQFEEWECNLVGWDKTKNANWYQPGLDCFKYRKKAKRSHTFVKWSNLTNMHDSSYSRGLKRRQTKFKVERIINVPRHNLKEHMPDLNDIWYFPKVLGSTDILEREEWHFL